MPLVRIPDMDPSTLQPFSDIITMGAGDGQPAITIMVKCYPAIQWWYMVTFRSDGTLLVPAKVLATTPNLWDAHQATIRSLYGRGLSCTVVGESVATVPLFQRCTITIEPVSPTLPAPVGVT